MCDSVPIVVVSVLAYALEALNTGSLYLPEMLFWFENQATNCSPESNRTQETRENRWHLLQAPDKVIRFLASSRRQMVREVFR